MIIKTISHCNMRSLFGGLNIQLNNVPAMEESSNQHDSNFLLILIRGVGEYLVVHKLQRTLGASFPIIYFN